MLSLTASECDLNDAITAAEALLSAAAPTRRAVTQAANRLELATTPVPR